MGTIYASYSSAWVNYSQFIESLKNRLIIKQDFLMDWSLLRPHAKHALLRDNLLYSNHIVVRLAINDLPF